MAERSMDEENREAGHSDDCRERMEATIREDPAQQQRLEAADWLPGQTLLDKLSEASNQRLHGRNRKKNVLVEERM